MVSDSFKKLEILTISSPIFNLIKMHESNTISFPRNEGFCHLTISRFKWNHFKKNHILVKAGAAVVSTTFSLYKLKRCLFIFFSLSVLEQLAAVAISCFLRSWLESPVLT